MNFIAVFLLEQGFTEEETFAIMKYLCNEVIPLDYYTNMVSMFSDKVILVEMLRYFNRSLYTKIRKFDSDIASMVFPWFICLFTKGEFSREVPNYQARSPRSSGTTFSSMDSWPFTRPGSSCSTCSSRQSPRTPTSLMPSWPVRRRCAP